MPKATITIRRISGNETFQGIITRFTQTGAFIHVPTTGQDREKSLNEMLLRSEWFPSQSRNVFFRVEAN